MTPRNAPFALVAVSAGLFAQACVLYRPAAANRPPREQPPAFPAQNAGEPPAAPAAADRGPESYIDQLLEPIALYPDPLIALMLPAATEPADILAAAAYLVQYGDLTRVDSKPWDRSVRSLSHYPAVITWMADNPAWTRALGAAFLSSPAAVMRSIQRLRARALAAGALASTPQQRVSLEDGDIEILPGQPDSIYVPAYDADVVYSEEPYYGYGGPLIDFGAAWPVGPWLSFCIDWRGQGVWVGGWHEPHFGGRRAPPGFRPWRPHHRLADLRPVSPSPQGNPAPHPRPMRGTPLPPEHFWAPAAAWQGPRRGFAESRYTPPQWGQGGIAAAPAPARAQAAAPASNSAPAYQAAPAATHESASASTQSPSSRNR